MQALQTDTQRLGADNSFIVSITGNNITCIDTRVSLLKKQATEEKAATLKNTIATLLKTCDLCFMEFNTRYYPSIFKDNAIKVLTTALNMLNVGDFTPAATYLLQNARAIEYLIPNKPKNITQPIPGLVAQIKILCKSI